MPNGCRPGLYVHVPYCSAICPYCEFAVARAGAGERERYVDLLVAEAALWRERWPAFEARPFDTVYLGGGTPSILEPQDLERLLAGVRESLTVAPDAWLSLEANPEDVTPDRVAAWRGLGIRTVSLGIQSFDRRALKFLGRRHTPEEAERSVERALGSTLEGSFDAVSVDLIFGLPADREDPEAPYRSLDRSLDRVTELRPHHVSCYQLTIHQGTPFGRGVARGVIRELPEPAQAAAYERLVDRLQDAGYRPYEVSNFALADEGKDYRSRHNRKYWRHVPYLGLGPSSHSFAVTERAEDGAGGPVRGRRWWNERSIPRWGELVEEGRENGEPPVAGVEELEPEVIALETVMLGLRTAEGVDLADFEERFGVELVDRNRALVERLEEEGLVEVASEGEQARLRPTLRGFAVADGLPAGFEVV